MWLEWEARGPRVEVTTLASVTETRPQSPVPWIHCPPPQVGPDPAQSAPASLDCSPPLASGME